MLVHGGRLWIAVKNSSAAMPNGCSYTGTGRVILTNVIIRASRPIISVRNDRAHPHGWGAVLAIS